jgi:transposase
MPRRAAAPGTKPRKNTRIFKRIFEDTAGIDAGSSEHWVAVADDRDEQPVRRFGTTTRELNDLARWLLSCRVRRVAVEATGVYCQPLLAVLEKHGIETRLVKSSSLKAVNEYQKSDMLDCQWIQVLETFGLLRAAFRPSPEISRIRVLSRERRDLIEQATQNINKMNKALTAMNVRLDLAVSDITGQTGLRIINAILQGQRDPNKLAELRDDRCQKSVAQIADALNGEYDDAHLFVLQNALDLFNSCRTLIARCDARIEQSVQSLEPKASPADVPAPRRKEHVRKNVFAFEAREAFFSVLGTDLTQIDGISTSTVCTFIAEVGTNVDAWSTEKHFCSWLRLSPGSNKTGGKQRSSRNAPTANRLTTALHVAAQTLTRSNSALGAFYRRMRSRMGPDKAIKAAAHHLARQIYFCVKYRRQYVDPGPQYYQVKNRDRAIAALSKRARALGLTLVESPA